MITKDFLLAGRAIFTVHNSSGERYTYKITKKESSAQFPEAHFASLLTGPSNESDYTYMGQLQYNLMRVVPTKKSQYTIESKPMRV